VLTRRRLLAGLAGSAGTGILAEIGATQPGVPAEQENDHAHLVRATTNTDRWDAVVVGAGVFGTWTAWNLRRAGKRVLLLDAWGAAHARASSGGESRLIRTAYGPDEIYTRMAWESLADWKWLSARAGLPILQQVGVLFFFAQKESYATRTLEVHERLGLPIQSLGRAELARRFPQFSWNDIEMGLYEPDCGALMARRAVQTLVSQFSSAGGEYRLAAVQLQPSPGHAETGDTLDSLVLSGGERVHAAQYVFACGPWLPKLFPDLLASRMFVTRQEVFWFAPPSADAGFGPGSMPGWADFNGGDIYYGLPDLESRGVKLAHDRHGPRMDPDVGDRELSPGELADVRAYMARRFPALAGRPLNEARVCQYENSSNGDFIIDRHPRWRNVLLVGAGSGHGFKHGPAVGAYAARRVLGESVTLEPRFSLSGKADTQQRTVR